MHHQNSVSPNMSTANSPLQEHDNHNSMFFAEVKDRGGWLVGLLILQSMSSFILQYNEKFLTQHIVIYNFLTMLVGAGGNAGNQASVRGTVLIHLLVYSQFLSIVFILTWREKDNSE